MSDTDPVPSSPVATSETAVSPWARWLQSTLLKVIVTVAGLTYAFSRISLRDAWLRILDAEIGWLAAGFALITTSLVLRAFRWQTILKGLGLVVPFGQLVRLYFIGNFFNMFLPSGLGGDVVRAVGATRDLSPNLAAGTVILDRMTGLLALFMMALLAMPFRPDDFSAELALFIIGLALIGLLVGGLVLQGNLVLWLGERMADWPLVGWVWQKSRPSLEAIQACRKSAVFGALAISFLFNLMLVGWWYTTGRALQLAVSYLYYLLVVPILSISTLIPSIGGIGPRESFAPTLFASAGVSFEAAVTLAFLVLILLRLSGLLGAFVYLADKTKRT